MQGLSIGKLAKSVGINIETIRYYERVGMMPEPQRRESGYRVYSEDDEHRLKFIRHAKELGFSLREIRELLELRVDHRNSCEEVRVQTEAKIADIEQKIVNLERIRRALMKLAAACRERGPSGECPILEALEEETFKLENNNH